MLKQNQNDKLTEEVDALVQIEYQKYLESKKLFLGSNEKRKEKPLKENRHYNNSPETVTFGRLKQMNKSQQNFQKLLQMLNCRSFQEALTKVDRVNKADTFLGRVKEMVQQCDPQQEPTLKHSWVVIKEAVFGYYRKKKQQQREQ